MKLLRLGMIGVFINYGLFIVLSVLIGIFIKKKQGILAILVGILPLFIGGFFLRSMTHVLFTIDSPLKDKLFAVFFSYIPFVVGLLAVVSGIFIIVEKYRAKKN